MKKTSQHSVSARKMSAGNLATRNMITMFWIMQNDAEKVSGSKVGDEQHTHSGRRR